MSYSLRELLAVMFLAGLGLAALSVGGWLASAMMCLAMLLLMGLAIIAFVGRGSEQAYAIGFVIPAICYGVLVWSGGEEELNPWEGRLPTTQMIQPLFQAMNKFTWVDAFSGKELPNYVPPASGFSGGGPPPGGIIASPKNSLNQMTYTATAHLLFALALGYAGAKFAVVVHRRSTPQSPAP